MTFPPPAECVIIHDPARTEDTITAVLRKHGTENVLALTQASEFADHGDRDQALRSLRDAATVLTRTEIGRADAENLVSEHALHLAAAVGADFQTGSTDAAAPPRLGR
ncbi:hypothetical protein BJY24_005746 [Nocardia transvalensis]|uniref:Uncharacterized protein n=1 Tax=Nocardia transvalensis TaxID=37333 RepID=A0A7W9UKT1_9NOCA|nr:hypothetical protein [Nocardia transvalensis]MBB5916834.1 hypothetical protein [Nocardia transvalensis]